MTNEKNIEFHKVQYDMNKEDTHKTNCQKGQGVYFFVTAN